MLSARLIATNIIHDMTAPVSFRRQTTRTQRSPRTTRTFQPRESKYLDNKFWRPYRNSDQLMGQVYQITHPDYLDIADQELGLGWPTF